MQTNKQSNLIVELTLNFALKIIKYVELLERNHKYVIGRQLLKAGTSIGANVREAQNAESRIDFIHKMKIAAKEADETEYWLLLCNRSDEYANCDELLNDCTSIMKVLSKIISSSKTFSI
ncbi:MAG: four helix bundle protein [Chitinophagaceae bacterium]|jgi:four helix bundle protein|nr:four helix bundle protein [Chitinophagaceae bacterium]